MIPLLNGATANGSGQAFRLDADMTTRDNPTLSRVFVATGIFDGATITVTVSGDGVNFAGLSSNTFTSPSAKMESLPNEIYAKATVTSAGASTNINLHVV